MWQNTFANALLKPFERLVKYSTLKGQGHVWSNEMACRLCQLEFSVMRFSEYGIRSAPCYALTGWTSLIKSHPETGCLLAAADSIYRLARDILVRETSWVYPLVPKIHRNCCNCDFSYQGVVSVQDGLTKVFRRVFSWRTLTEDIALYYCSWMWDSWSATYKRVVKRPFAWIILSFEIL